MTTPGRHVGAVLGAKLPASDWQFWVVTAAALVAAWFLLRPLLRLVRGRAPRTRRVSLTIGGKAVDGKGSPPH